MNAADFVYSQIYKKALAGGACERSALSAAVRGVEKYKKNKFKKTSVLIEGMIREAIKDV